MAKVVPEVGRVDIMGLTVDFKSKKSVTRALEKTNITLNPGTFAALIGPSGCGKSTLLNVVAGFVQPSEGGVAVDNRGNPTRRDCGRKEFSKFCIISMVFSSRERRISSQEVQLGREERRKKAMEALREVKLEEHAEKFPANSREE